MKKLFFISLMCGFIVGISAMNPHNTQKLSKIKAGELILFCNVKKHDFQKIDPRKVVRVEYEDGEGVVEYKFTNGWSRNCYTVRSKNGHKHSANAL